MFIVDRDQRRIQDLPAGADHSKRAEREPERASPSEPPVGGEGTESFLSIFVQKSGQKLRI